MIRSRVVGGSGRVFPGLLLVGLVATSGSACSRREPEPSREGPRPQPSASAPVEVKRQAVTFDVVTNSSNFNGTAIPAPRWIWFTSVMKVNGVGSTPVNLYFNHAHITFTAGGTSYDLPVPNSHITIDPAATLASTSFNTATQTWETVLPVSFSGNAFLGALAWQVPANLPGGTNPVTWSASFQSDAAISVNWQWAAAVYTTFSGDYNALLVKPVDDPNKSVYANSHKAGSPEAFLGNVTGGARGGGGSNYTGSLSGTVSLTPQQLCIGVTCTAQDQCHVAGVCLPATGVCTNPAAANGTSCNDANACSQTDSCQSGACAGSNPVVCAASDQCHVAGTCDTGTGACSNPAAANGTACSDGNFCTQSDSCQAGACAGSNPVVCAASDQCHVAGTCDTATGACSNPAVDDGTTCTDGNFCTKTDACLAGTCAGNNPVVCTASDQCHVAGTCDTGTGACSNPAAANGTGCTDSSACTQTDTCQAGACAGSNPVVCTASDQCHVAGTCNTGTGACSNPAVADGVTCSDGNACTQTDACQAGACTGSNPVVCTASDQCHVAGTCDTGTGACSNLAAADGVTCSDGNACTQTDACEAGACTGSNPVVCTASDQCHVAGTCDTGTGACSNPAAADGVTCSDSNVCTQSDSCQAGACAGSNPVVCTASDQCHVAGTCDTATGACSNPAVDDGTSCANGTVCDGAETCSAGTCADGTPLTLDDANPCTTDACDASAGVTHVILAAGSPCGVNLVCDATAQCVPLQGGNEPPVVTLFPVEPLYGSGSVLLFSLVNDDGLPNEQLTYYWTLVSGPFPVTFSSPFEETTYAHFNNDGQPHSGHYVLRLTVSDGEAQSFAEVAVDVIGCVAEDDGDACTIDRCSPHSGESFHLAMGDGASCTNGNVCDGAETCDAAGACLPGTSLVLSDANPCTVDACDASAGVTNVAMPAGTTCGVNLVCNSAVRCVSLDGSNLAPVVEAIPLFLQSAYAPTTVLLFAFVTDDGRPGGELTYQWSSRVLKNPVRRRFVDRSGGCGAGIVAVSIQAIGRVILSFDAGCSRRGLLG